MKKKKKCGLKKKCDINGRKTSTFDFTADEGKGSVNPSRHNNVYVPVVLWTEVVMADARIMGRENRKKTRKHWSRCRKKSTKVKERAAHQEHT